MKNIIAYYRVSTDKQGKSGLGLEAQEAAVGQLARQHNGAILAFYKEIETGKRKDRPELAKALLHAKRARATLVVAKLDRLARNVAFLSALMEMDVPFVACDNPQANRLTLHILSAVAEAEAVAISERTTAALAALKARGVKLGSAREGHWDGLTLDQAASRAERRLEGCRKGRIRAAEVLSEQARKAREELAPVILAMKAEGLTLSAIASRLNAEGWRTRRGKKWHPVYVCEFLKGVKRDS